MSLTSVTMVKNVSKAMLLCNKTFAFLRKASEDLGDIKTHPGLGVENPISALTIFWQNINDSPQIISYLLISNNAIQHHYRAFDLTISVGIFWKCIVRMFYLGITGSSTFI